MSHKDFPGCKPFYPSGVKNGSSTCIFYFSICTPVPDFCPENSGICLANKVDFSGSPAGNKTLYTQPINIGSFKEGKNHFKAGLFELEHNLTLSKVNWSTWHKRGIFYECTSHGSFKTAYRPKFKLVLLFLKQWCGEENPNLQCCGDLKSLGVQCLCFSATVLGKIKLFAVLLDCKTVVFSCIGRRDPWVWSTWASQARRPCIGLFLLWSFWYHRIRI